MPMVAIWIAISLKNALSTSVDVIGANLKRADSLGLSPLGVPCELVPRRMRDLLNPTVIRISGELGVFLPE